MLRAAPRLAWRMLFFGEDVLDRKEDVMRRTIVLLGAMACFAIAMPRPARAGVCGNGVLEAGEECDAGAAACTYLSTAPEAPMIDCRNAQCTQPGTGADYACTDRCLLTPACRPLLRDPAKIIFRTRPKLDSVVVDGRTVPLTTMDPANEAVALSVSNAFGTIYQEILPLGKFIPNLKLTTWKYVLKRTGFPMIYNFKITKKFNRLTGNTEFTLKAKAEANGDVANPAVMVGHTLDELKTMTIEMIVGDDVFYNTADWARKTNGWYLADKFLYM